jgi:hypothetical protein
MERNMLRIIGCNIRAYAGEGIAASTPPPTPFAVANEKHRRVRKRESSLARFQYETR